MPRLLRWVMFGVLVGGFASAMPAETVAGLPAKPAGYVDDYAGVLSAETQQNLENLCTQVDQQAHAQIAVVTVKSMDADKDGTTPTIEEFATALEDKWKVGAKGTDKGVLLIVSLNPRKYRIEVGYGLEGVLNDAKAGDIGREMAPYLHTGDYDQGISVAVKDLAGDIAADAGVNLQIASQSAPTRVYRNTQPQGSPLGSLVVVAIIIIGIGILIRTGHIGWLFFILFNLLGGGGGGRGGGFGGGGEGGGGGGFGGFGGGSSGGGGASGDF